MERTKKERLEAKGWKVGTVGEFLELTQEESTLIETKLSTKSSLKQGRKSKSTIRFRISNPNFKRSEYVKHSKVFRISVLRNS
ncbi:MAG TPA: hypothetical protein V6D15_09785 [Oculatellaceae cyanobacterium]|jgi:hypothetical protein